MKILIYLFTLFLFTSCVTQNACLKKFPPETKVEYVDTVVYVSVPFIIPADTMHLVDTVPCEDFKIGNDSIRVEVKDRIIYVESVRKADTVVMDSVRVDVVTEKVTVEHVRKVPRWDLIIGALIVGMLLMVFIIKKV